MKNNKAVTILLNLHPLQRVLLSLGLTIVVFFFIRQSVEQPLVLYMLLWDIFAFVYIGTGWIIFFNRPPEQIRKVARIDDGSRSFVSFIIILSSFSSLFATLLLLLGKDISSSSHPINLPVVIFGMLSSWAMVHTTFSIHYAHLYYNDNEDDKTKHAAGLSFPKEKTPDYLDFAYFAFVIGMTFQVSDVQIESRIIRRTALLHGLIAFALNTFVVALTINLIAGLKSGS